MRYKEKLLLPLFFILAICFALPAVAQDKPELKLEELFVLTIITRIGNQATGNGEATLDLMSFV